MGQHVTDRAVNPVLLSHELGDVSLRVIGPRADGTTVVRVPARSDAVIEAAVAVHPVDPSWQPPAAAPTNRDRIAEMRTKAAAVIAGTDNFTAAESQRLLARLVLEVTA